MEASNLVDDNNEKKIDSLGRAYSTGKRKASIARVWLKRGSGSVKINGKDENKYFHLFGGGITCWVIWQTTTFLGIVLGAFIPEKLGLSFAVPLTFLALLVNDFRKLINVIVIIISGFVATFGFNYVPYKAYVIVAGVTALLTAAILTKLNKKNE